MSPMVLASLVISCASVGVSLCSIYYARMLGKARDDLRALRARRSDGCPTSAP